MKGLGLFFVLALFAVAAAYSHTPADTANLKTPVDTSWEKGGAASFNISQVSLSNWAAGG